MDDLLGLLEADATNDDEVSAAAAGATTPSQPSSLSGGAGGDGDGDDVSVAIPATSSRRRDAAAGARESATTSAERRRAPVSSAGASRSAAASTSASSASAPSSGSSIFGNLRINFNQPKISRLDLIDLLAPHDLKTPSDLVGMNRTTLDSIITVPSSNSGASGNGGGGGGGKTNVALLATIFTHTGTRISSSTGSAFSILEVGDFITGPQISIFLFGEAYSEHAKRGAASNKQGNAVAILCPDILPKKQNNGGGYKDASAISLAIRDPSRLIPVGSAVDYAMCSGTERKQNRQSGRWEDTRCTQWVDKRLGLFCKKHLRQALGQNNGVGGGGKGGQVGIGGAKGAQTFMQRQKMSTAMKMRGGVMNSSGGGNRGMFGRGAPAAQQQVQRQQQQQRRPASAAASMEAMIVGALYSNQNDQRRNKRFPSRSIGGATGAGQVSNITAMARGGMGGAMPNSYQQNKRQSSNALLDGGGGAPSTTEGRRRPNNIETAADRDPLRSLLNPASSNNNKAALQKKKTTMSSQALQGQQQRQRQPPRKLNRDVSEYDGSVPIPQPKNKKVKGGLLFPRLAPETLGQTAPSTAATSTPAAGGGPRQWGAATVTPDLSALRERQRVVKERLLVARGGVSGGGAGGGNAVRRGRVQGKGKALSTSAAAASRASSSSSTSLSASSSSRPSSHNKSSLSLYDGLDETSLLHTNRNDSDSLLHAKSRFASLADAETYAKNRLALTELEKREDQHDLREARKNKRKQPTTAATGKEGQQKQKKQVLVNEWYCATCQRKVNGSRPPKLCVRAKHVLRRTRDIRQDANAREARLGLQGKEVKDGGLTIGSGLEWSGWRRGI